MPGGVVNFNLKISNLGARRGGGVHFLIDKFQTLPQYCWEGIIGLILLIAIRPSDGDVKPGPLCAFREEHSSFSNLSVTWPRSQITLQPFRCFTYVIAHSPTFPSLDLRHSSLQSFRCFTYVTALSNPSAASPTSQLSPTLPLLHLRHSQFSNVSVTWPTSQFILQLFFRFSYDTGFSLKSPGEPPMAEKLFSKGPNSKLNITGSVGQEANSRIFIGPINRHT